MADNEGAQVTFDLKEVDAVKKMLANAALTAADRAKLLGSIGNEMETQTWERFQTKQEPGGDTWKAIAEKTRLYYERYKKDTGPQPPLILYGMLQQSITSQVQGGGWSVLVGATMEYAAVHQFGWPKKNIPARPYLGVSAEDTKVIEMAVADFLAGNIL